MERAQVNLPAGVEFNGGGPACGFESREVESPENELV